MRGSILIAGALMLLAGCGGKSEAPSETVNEEDPAQIVLANDITAIDAVSGEAANMAADVNYVVEPVDANATETNGAAPARPRPRAAAEPARARPASPAPARAEPASENESD